jgi:hypothetical protein
MYTAPSSISRCHIGTETPWKPEICYNVNSAALHLVASRLTINNHPGTDAMNCALVCFCPQYALYIRLRDSVVLFPRATDIICKRKITSVF